THHKTSPDCGATGPIAYEKGKAYSVNTIGGKVVDWRFGLHELPTGCKECQRHIDAAKQTAEDVPFRTAWGSRSTPPADRSAEGGSMPHYPGDVRAAFLAQLRDAEDGEGLGPEAGDLVEDSSGQQYFVESVDPYMPTLHALDRRGIVRELARSDV